IHVFQEVPGLAGLAALEFLRHALLIADERVFINFGGIAPHPDTSAFAASALAHKAQFVFAGNCGRMHLHEFAVGVSDALLIGSAGSGTSIDARVSRTAKEHARSARAENNGIGAEGMGFQVADVCRDNPATYALTVLHKALELPKLILFD